MDLVKDYTTRLEVIRHLQSIEEEVLVAMCEREFRKLLLAIDYKLYELLRESEDV